MIFLINWLVVRRGLKNVDQCYPKAKMTTSNILFCPQPKYIQFTVTDDLVLLYKYKRAPPQDRKTGYQCNASQQTGSAPCFNFTSGQSCSCYTVDQYIWASQPMRHDSLHYQNVIYSVSNIWKVSRATRVSFYPHSNSGGLNRKLLSFAAKVNTVDAIDLLSTCLVV